MRHQLELRQWGSGSDAIPTHLEFGHRAIVRTGNYRRGHRNLSLPQRRQIERTIVDCATETQHCSCSGNHHRTSAPLPAAGPRSGSLPEASPMERRGSASAGTAFDPESAAGRAGTKPNQRSCRTALHSRSPLRLRYLVGCPRVAENLAPIGYEQRLRRHRLRSSVMFAYAFATFPEVR